MTRALRRDAGRLDRRSVLRNGLLVGLGAVAISTATPEFMGVAEAAAPNPQPGWKHCGYCDGLFFANGATYAGVCHSIYAEGHGYHHVADSPTSYSVYNGEADSGIVQAGWRWCNWCQLIFWGKGLNTSACPANIGAIVNGQTQIGPHNYGSNTVYDLVHDISASYYQTNWRWCNLCQGIFYGPMGSGTYSSCPGRERNDGYSGPHSYGSATNYNQVYT